MPTGHPVQSHTTNEHVSTSILKTMIRLPPANIRLMKSRFVDPPKCYSTQYATRVSRCCARRNNIILEHPRIAENEPANISPPRQSSQGISAASSQRLTGILMSKIKQETLYSSRIVLIMCPAKNPWKHGAYQFGTMENMQRKTGRTSFLSLGIVPKTTLIVS